MLSEC